MSPARQLIPRLLRERGFRRYWGAQTISMFGDQISSIVLPLVGVLTLHAGAAQMGYLAGLEWLPSLLFGLHAGAWVDRFGHRRALMIAADLGRAAVLASVPACYAAGVLTLAQLYGVALATGTLSVCSPCATRPCSWPWCPGTATSRAIRWSTGAGRCRSSAAQRRRPARPAADGPVCHRR